MERFEGGVTRLRMQSTAGRVAGYDVSAYVVRGILVDTGFHRARDLLIAGLDQLRPRGAIVTHWHEDHAGNVELLASRGLPLLMREETEIILRRRPDVKLYRRAVWGHPPPLRSSIERLDFEDLEVIHTPGHSPDHQVVWDPDSETVFTGDLWLGVKSRLMHESEDPYEIVRSLRVVLARKPVQMFDAHRGLIGNAITALQARIEWLEETIATIERRIGAGLNDRAITREVLGREALSALVSAGEYAKRNLVRAVRRKSGSVG